MLTLKKLARLLIESGRCTLMPTGVGRMLRRGGAPKPTLDLDFTRGTMPAGLTFSRTSNATRVGPTGLLEWAPHNFLINSVFAGGTSGTVGSGAVAPTGWTLGFTGGSITYAPSTSGVGTAIQFVATAGRPLVQQNYTVSAGTTYVLSMRVEAVSGSVRADSFSGFGGLPSGSTQTWRVNGGGAGATLVAVGDLVEVVLVTTTTGGSVQARVGLGALNTATGDVTLSRPQFEQNGAATAYNPTTGSAYYGPRFDYDPVTLACRGLLIEESRTNLITGSRVLSLSGVTGSQNSVGVDGVNNAAWGLVEDTGNNQHFFFPTGSISLTSGTTYSLGCLIKANVATRIQLTGASAIFGTSQYANFSLTGSGSVLASSGVTAFIRQIAPGFYYCAISLAATATASGSGLVVAFINSDTATRLPTYAGSGTASVVADHCQVEVGAFPSSIIPTFGAAATRAADSLTSTLGSWFNPLQGTLYAEGDNAISAAGAGSICDVGFDDGTANNRIYLRSLVTSGNTQGTIVSGGTVLTNLNAGSNLGYFVRKKSAFGFVAGRQTVVQDGAIVVQSSVALPAGLNRLTIAQGASSAAKNARISRVTYYPVALPDAALQALTR